MNLSPVGTLVLTQLLRRHRSYQEISERHWTLARGETALSPPAIYFQEDLDRVTQIHDSTRETEMLRLKGGRRDHRATVAYLLRSVELAHGKLYRGAMQMRLAPGPRNFIGPSTTELVTEAALACTPFGGIFFGHWLADDLLLHLAAESLALPVWVERARYHHESDYCSVLQIERTSASRTRFDRLILIDDVGQNSYRKGRGQLLRQRLRAAIEGMGYTRVYLRRGVRDARLTRVLVNASEVERYLESQGFVTIDPDRLSVPELVAALLDTRIVVGVEGSHLAHTLYTLAPQGVLCVLQPAYRFTNIFKDWGDQYGLRYAFTTGAQVPGGFEIHLDDLRRILERVEPYL
jgi:Glycosyltransferase 61